METNATATDPANDWHVSSDYDTCGWHVQVLSDHPEVARAMIAQVSRSEDWHPPPHSTAPEVLSPKGLRELRALGYVD